MLLHFSSIFWGGRLEPLLTGQHVSLKGGRTCSKRPGSDLAATAGLLPPCTGRRRSRAGSPTPLLHFMSNKSTHDDCGVDDGLGPVQVIFIPGSLVIIRVCQVGVDF